jgi:hypothetical protein
VRPEAADYLEKARNDLEDARKVAAIGLVKIAARTAYYADFHAAEAFVVERTGKIRKNAFWLESRICPSSEGDDGDRQVSPEVPHEGVFI